LRRIPVAVLSADATATHSRRLRGIGAAAYLAKPLDINDVLDLVDSFLLGPKDPLDPAAQSA
jgi:DNA-binding response OmpR family regulator